MLNELPKGWCVAQLGDVLQEHNDRCGEQSELSALSLTKALGLVLARERFGRALHNKDTSNYRHVRKGEVVLDPMLLWDGTIARLTRFEEGFVSPDYRVYRVTDDISPMFLDFLLASHDLRMAYKNNARGTNKRRNRIARKDFLAIKFLLPPLPEQQKIVEILSSVDEAIEATEAVIEQTRRVKEGLLQELLTKGIGHTRFKQTPIGEIPEDWEVKRLGEVLASITSGKSPSAKDEPAKGFEWGVLRVSAVGHGEFHQNQNKALPLDYVVEPKHVVKSGDLLITRANTAALVAATCKVPVGEYQLMLCDKTLRLTPHHVLIDSDYLLAALNQPRARHYFALAATGSSASMKNVSQADIRGLKVALPPICEQREIAMRALSVGKAIKAELGNLYQLKKAKVGLLQDLLSGKVRVSA